MNNYDAYIEKRQRAKTLLIVEGNHEKNKLFELMLRCFPQIDIQREDIVIYETNIYILYDKLSKEFGTEWWQNDIDIAEIISENREQKYYKRNFMNIFLIFDYERQDTNFSEDKILHLQRYFNDETDMGKLYINYPMVESYQHLLSIPDDSYKDRKMTAGIRKGKEYKTRVNRESVIAEKVELPEKLSEILKEHYGMEETFCTECCNKMLDISTEDDLEAVIGSIIGNGIREEIRKTAINHCCAILRKQNYLTKHYNYWRQMKELLIQIILHNIRKANYVEGNDYDIEKEAYRQVLFQLDAVHILEIQNTCSRNRETGYIWVLNTCVLFVAEYQFSYIEDALENG